MWPPAEKLKLGIDLAGGTILVYQVQEEGRPPGFDMDKMIEALSMRINPTGTLDVTLRPLGTDRVEIILPASDPQEVQMVQDRITRLGQLEFRILANEKHDAAAIRQAREMWRRKGARTAPPGYEWVKLAKPDEFNARGQRPGEDVAVEDGYVLTKIPDERLKVTGDDLVRAYPTQDQRFQLAVGFQFNSRGARRFAHLTRAYKPESDGFHYRLAIILDRQVMSAPVINEPIEGGHGIIEGGRDGFKTEEADNLIAVLNAGKLPAMLDPTPVSKDTITATLGEDTIRKGKWAITAAMIAVPVFMVIYYGFAGIIAVLALFLNILLILGFMGLTRSTFTLPGLAGLALTIGMAVDANVLIFERIREERSRGGSLRAAVRNGYDRAWFAILDANLTTIITGLVLYWIGTDQVKGFALTLTVGLAINLFTAVYVSRTIFMICVEQRWFRDVKMMHLFKWLPEIDFISLRRYFITGSAVFIVAGLVAVVLRGSELLDIEFTGGTAIAIRLKQAPDEGAEYVRRTALAAPELPNVKVERLILEGESREQSGRRYLIRTTNSNQNSVRQAVIRQFDGELATIELTWTKPVLLQQDHGESAKSAKSGKEGSNSKPSDKQSGAKAAAKAGKETQKKANSAGGDGQPQGHEKQQVKQEAKKGLTQAKAAKRSEARGKSTGEKVWQVHIETNEPVSTATLADKVNKVLADEGISQPELLYSLKSEGKSGELATSFILETRYSDPVGLLKKVRAAFAKEPLFERINTFGSQIASETQQKAILAVILSWCAIVLYLGLRFRDFSHGVAAVVALVHDVLVTLGCVAIGAYLARIPLVGPSLLLDEFRIYLSVVAAFLTLVGYSVNDTIVIFDRVRELRGRSPFITSEMINKGINQCMSRTILTSLTTLVVEVILYIWGGPGVHAFAFAVMVGTITGTYSTMFIASPILDVFAARARAQWEQKRVRYEKAAARA